MRELCRLALFAFLSFSCSAIKPEVLPTSNEPPASMVGLGMPYATSFSPADVTAKTLTPAGKTFAVRFGPRLLELKASYLEKGEMAIDPNGISQNDNLRRYLNLLATSSFGGTGLTGEGELSYSSLHALPDECACKDWPRMLRLGLKHRWGGLSYGADYKSVDRGFVSIAGVPTDATRDEGLVWGERSLGLFNIRGSIGESWEKLLDGNGLKVSRNAMASLNLNRSQWGAKFASSYEWVEQGAAPNQETTVFTNTLTAFYRPFDFVSLNPNVTIREERNPYTGVRTESPRTELIFSYVPPRDLFKVTGSTSFGRSSGSEGLSRLTSFGTTAAVDWKIGKFLGKDDYLSFNLNYNEQHDFVSSGNTHNDLSGMLRLRITGF